LKGKETKLQLQIKVVLGFWLSRKERRERERNEATNNRNSMNSGGEYIFHGGELFQTVRFIVKSRAHIFSLLFLFSL